MYHAFNLKTDAVPHFQNKSDTEETVIKMFVDALKAKDLYNATAEKPLTEIQTGNEKISELSSIVSVNPFQMIDAGMKQNKTTFEREAIYCS